MNRIVLSIASSLLLFYGCQSNPVLPEATQIVLQAYLYAGQPVNDVTVMLSRPISSTDTANAMVSDASVSLTKNGATYKLLPLPQDTGRYYYPGSDLAVQPGDQFEITVSYGGTNATAETVVPAFPVGLSTNISTIVITEDSVTTPFGGTFTRLTSSDSLVVSWNNPSRLPYYVVMESVDSARQPLRSDTLGGFNFARRFVTEPTTNDYFQVPQDDFGYTGKYKITLYRVNQDYVNLYASRQQDSRALNEPLTNVKNGLGIFTAFASDSTFVNVELQ